MGPKLNVFRMRLLGAEVKPASSGAGPSRTPETRPCRRVATVETSHYCRGS